LPGVTAVDDVVRSSAVCASEFGREDGGGERELVGDPEAVCQGGWKLASRGVEPFEVYLIFTESFILAIRLIGSPCLVIRASEVPSRVL
jgi:hypothetical protein